MIEPVREHVDAREVLASTHPHRAYALDVRGLSAGYPRQPPAIEGVTLAVAEGELVGLVGPNGAGKSTLFKAIVGLRPLAAGEVRVFGQPLARARDDVAYMPQVEEVEWAFPVSVLDVVLSGRRRLLPFRGWSAVDRAVAWDALERVHLAQYARRQAGQLSGGERRRLLLARTIARGSRLLLLDEPFAGLDAAVQHDLVAILDALVHAGRSILVATHDLSCVANSCDEAVCLNRRVIAAGPSSAVLTEEVLSRTFERHLLPLTPGGPPRIAVAPPASGSQP
ncbi:MAG: ABC transporter ATP-binding protein [Chloroflexi bacterium]|nr:ABC transporter ATP-binding protein [Chloroflexota bacterium]